MSYLDWQDQPVYPDEFVPRVPGMEDPRGAFAVPDMLSPFQSPMVNQAPVGGPLLPQDGPPAYPDLLSPAVATMPQPGFRERLAAGLANQPGYTPQPFEGGASRFGRGLLAGAARGFSGGTLLGMKNQQAQVDAKNVENKTAADRANALRLESWKAQLTDYYGQRKDDRGKVTVTAQDATETELPEGAKVSPEALASARMASKTFNVNNAPVPVMKSDWDYLLKRNGGEGLNAAIIDEYTRTGGTLSKGAYASFQDAIRNARAEDNTIRMARATGQKQSYEDMRQSASNILDGIAAGRLNPDIRAYGTRDGFQRLLAEGADLRGMDLYRLQVEYAANMRNASSDNSPQAKKFRNTLNNLPHLLDQMLGMRDPVTGQRDWRTGKQPDGRPSILALLQSDKSPLQNRLKQFWAENVSGEAGPLKEYRQLATKLSMEQAYMTSFGNVPPVDVVTELLHSYASFDNPANIAASLAAVEQARNGYAQSYEDTGANTTPDFQGGVSPAVGTQRAFGDYKPVPPGMRRILHPDGSKALVPENYVIPNTPEYAGWRFE